MAVLPDAFDPKKNRSGFFEKKHAKIRNCQNWRIFLASKNLEKNHLLLQKCKFFEKSKKSQEILGFRGLCQIEKNREQ